MTFVRGLRPDYMVGTITLVSGSINFTTVDASLLSSSINQGDAIMTASGRVLIIDEITNDNAGKLIYPCPADAAGVNRPLHIRFQPSGSGSQGAQRDLAARWSKTGNVDTFAALESMLGGLPVFTEFGMEVIPLNDIGIDEPKGNLASLAGLNLAANQLPYFTDAGLTPFTSYARTMLTAVNNTDIYSALGTVPVVQIPSISTPDKAFRRWNIIGTVSQASGVPTGAILERGSNANGELVRLTDGTQNCKSLDLTVAIVAAIMSAIWFFPAFFASIPWSVSIPNFRGADEGASNARPRYLLSARSKSNSGISKLSIDSRRNRPNRKLGRESNCFNRKVFLMFKISLSPQYSENTLKLEKSGIFLIINGELYDFSTLNDGDEIPQDAISNVLIIGSITKESGVVNITITRPYSNIKAPESVRFPMPIMLTKDQIITFNNENDVENNIYPVIEPEPEG